MLTLQLNIGQETLRGLLAHWLGQRHLKAVPTAKPNGDVGLYVTSGTGEHGSNRRAPVGDLLDEANYQSRVLPNFEFSTHSPPSIITEGSHIAREC